VPLAFSLVKKGLSKPGDGVVWKASGVVGKFTEPKPGELVPPLM
jgi:hypothetical protein